MKKTLLSLSLITLALVGKAQDCTGLFISEYVEGGQNDKAIEIYNSSTQPITLDNNYRLVRYKEGVDEASSNASSQAAKLLGSYEVVTKVSFNNGVMAHEQHYNHTIKPHEVWVLIIQKLDTTGVSTETPVSPILVSKAAADTSHFAFICPDYTTSYAMSFNGNDALSLQKYVGGNWVYVDIFGQAGHNPNTISPTASSGYWTDCPQDDFDQTSDAQCGFTHNMTQDRTLIRKFTTKHGVTANPSPFNPTLEWDRANVAEPSLTDWWNNSQGTPDGTWPSPVTYTTINQLGVHHCDCNSNIISVHEYSKSLSQVKVYPNPSNGSLVKFMSTDKKIISMSFTNALGQEVKAVKLESPALVTEKELNLPKGIYFSQILFEDKSITIEKLIIE